jgi:hypothetical protein
MKKNAALLSGERTCISEKWELNLVYVRPLIHKVICCCL